jgi:beta,beta-carotene 9',10'-dioxygenase
MSSVAHAPAVTARKGFESLEDETRIAGLPVQGELPAWLTGSLLRTGPAKWEVGGRSMNHWFDGLAMLHRFSFDDGEVSYANRFLETRAYRAAKRDGRIAYSEFATDPCRSLFQRVTSLFSPKLTDNANVNLVKLGERFISMTETPIPVQFDPRSLETAGVAYKPPGMLTTAHPHLDRATKGMLNYAAKLGPRSSYRFFLLEPNATKPKVLASKPVREPAYMHSFGLTERWLVLSEFPYVVNPLSLALSGRPYIENYLWKPRFGFHYVNCFEQDGDVIADICAFRDASVVEDLYLERLRAGKPLAQPSLERFRISPASGEVTTETLVDHPMELPRINYGRCNERPYRYAWGVGAGPGASWLEQIVKADVEERRTAVWEQAGSYPGEPVFVAAPDADGEDEGVLLSVVLDGERGNSFLLVLDAGSLDELARAEVPHHIPFGFHGQYSRT